MADATLMTPPAAETAPKRVFPWSQRVLLVAIGQSIVKAGQLLMAAVLVRFLSDQEWAKVALLLSIYQVATGIGGLNLQQTIYFFLGRTPVEGRRIFLIQNVALLLASALVTALVLVTLASRFGGGRFAIEPMVYLIAIVVLIEIPTSGIGEILVSCERVATATRIQVLLALTQLVVVCVPILLTGRAEAGFQGLLIYAVLRLIVFRRVVRDNTAPPPPPRQWPWQRLDRARIREQLVYVAPLSLSTSLNLLSRNVDKWLVAAFDPLAYGAFAIAATELPLVSVLAGASSTVMVTRLVRAFRVGDFAYARQAFVAGGGRLSFVVLPTAVGLMLAGPELLSLFFTDSVAVAWLPFALTAGILFQRVCEYGVVMRAAGDTASLWWFNVIYLTCTAGFGYLGVHLLGAVGVAVGTLMANGVVWVFNMSRIRRAFRCTWRDVFPWRVYGQVLAVAAAAGLLAWGASRWVEPGVLRLVVKAAVFVPIYMGGVRWARIRRHVLPMPEEPDDLNQA